MEYFLFGDGVRTAAVRRVVVWNMPCGWAGGFSVGDIRGLGVNVGIGRLDGGDMQKVVGSRLV
jgi:hypothetical protein